MLSAELEKSLYRALDLATERKHTYATLEHLLLALTEDASASAALRACGADFTRLRADLINYIDNELENIKSEKIDQAKPTAGFQRALQRAAIHIQSAGRSEVTGANLLIAIFSERESHAFYFLHEHAISRDGLVDFVRTSETR